MLISPEPIEIEPSLFGEGQQRCCRGRWRRRETQYSVIAANELP
jgi:hypothetical protein